jgi:hypothetical protein
MASVTILRADPDAHCLLCPQEAFCMMATNVAMEAAQIYDESLVRAELNKKSSGANGPGTAPAGQQTQ